MDRRAEEVVIGLNRFSGSRTNSNENLGVAVMHWTIDQRFLNLNRAANRGGGGDEGRHDSIAGMLDFPAAGSFQRVTHDRVVDFDQCDTGIVAEPFHKFRRVDDVGKEDGANAAIAFLGLGNERGPRRIDFASAQKRLGQLWSNFDDFLSDETVRFAVDGVRRLGARGTAEAEDFPLRFVQPILVVFDAILPLRFEIGYMGRRNRTRSHPRHFVDVHIHRHLASFYRELRRVSQRLIDDAVALGQSRERLKLFLWSVGIQFKKEPYLRKTDGRVLSDTESPTKIQIALRANAAPA